MSDNPTKTHPPIQLAISQLKTIDRDLKNLMTEMKSVKSDISYIKRNLDKWLKAKEEKEIGELQAEQEGWFLWRS